MINIKPAAAAHGRSLGLGLITIKHFTEGALMYPLLFLLTSSKEQVRRIEIKRRVCLSGATFVLSLHILCRGTLMSYCRFR